MKVRSAGLAADMPAGGALDVGETVLFMQVLRAMEKNQKLAGTPVPANDSTLTEVRGRTLDVAALAAALAGIRADSQRDPEIYLQDTVVPSGGE